MVFRTPEFLKFGIPGGLHPGTCTGFRARSKAYARLLSQLNSPRHKRGTPYFVGGRGGRGELATQLVITDWHRDCNED